MYAVQICSRDFESLYVRMCQNHASTVMIRNNTYTLLTPSLRNSFLCISTYDKMATQKFDFAFIKNPIHLKMYYKSIVKSLQEPKLDLDQVFLYVDGD